MPNRIIKDSILTSETVGGLDDFAFRLFVSLICLADDYGRGRAHPAIIKGQAFPLRDDITKEQVTQGLSELAAADAIRLYEVNGTSYYYFPTWEKHQRVRGGVPKYPEPADNSPQLAATRRNSPQLAATRRNSPPNPIQSNPNIIQSNTRGVNIVNNNNIKAPTAEEVKTVCKEKGYETDPDKFWSYYQARSWKIQGEPIGDWRALLAYWASGDKKKESINDPGHFDDLADWVNMTRK